MLGSKSIHAQECYQGNFIGVDFGIHQDLSNDLPDNWREFNKKFIPVYLEKFCHFSGESSNGENSVNKPILKKNWLKAKEAFEL